MPATADYAKLGTTTWRCEIWFDNGHDSFAVQHEQAEYPNKGLAKAWMARTLPLRRNPADDRQQFWGRIERGLYVDDSHGQTMDATWELDEHLGARVFAYLDDDGAIDWNED